MHTFAVKFEIKKLKSLSLSDLSPASSHLFICLDKKGENIDCNLQECESTVNFHQRFSITACDGETFTRINV